MTFISQTINLIYVLLQPAKKIVILSPGTFKEKGGGYAVALLVNSMTAYC